MLWLILLFWLPVGIITVNLLRFPLNLQPKRSTLQMLALWEGRLADQMREKGPTSFYNSRAMGQGIGHGKSVFSSTATAGDEIFSSLNTQLSIWQLSEANNCFVALATQIRSLSFTQVICELSTIGERQLDCAN